jgi:hypothetical protein
MSSFTNNLHSLGFICAMAALLPNAAIAQQTDPNQFEQAPFSSENAILDTSIPFAIGAREAQQAIRGSFGWPTFQEGLVEGVYFRFDPDGYARFAPTPRLDSDVFEVICRPRTYSCMGRKGTLSVILNSRGQLQLKIDDVLSGDRFFVSEGVSEIEVPERILQPLDTQMEVLLSTGGDLIVRRGEKEKDRISLTGVYPLSAYLRWVAARQDYTILPRGWPVPNAIGSEAGLTQTASWQSPMPQPQNFSVVQQNAYAQQPNPYAAQPVPYTPQMDQNMQPILQAQMISPTESQSEVSEVKDELKLLRELLLARNQSTLMDARQTETNFEQPQLPSPTDYANEQRGLTAQIAALQMAANQIQADLARLAMPSTLPETNLGQIQFAPQAQLNGQIDNQMHQTETQSAASATAERLHYLMTEIGLDAKTALMLIQMGAGNSTPALSDPNGLVGSSAMGATQQTAAAGGNQNQNQNQFFQDSVVSQILSELETGLNDRSPATMPVENAIAKMSHGEYQLLSSYFKSVALHAK